MPQPGLDSPQRSLAVFIDIENLVASASTLGLPVTVEPLFRRLKEIGRVLLRRSFGDLKKCLTESGRLSQLDSVRRMMHENLVQMEDIPFVTRNKNTADLQLVVEALSVAYTNPGITTFVIVSSDRDYVPLYNKLHELGKSVITVPVDRENVHRMILEAADQVIYYESFFETGPAAPVPTGVAVPAAPAGVIAASPAPAHAPVAANIPAPSPAPVPELNDLYLEYVRALQQAIRAFGEEARPSVGAALRPRLVQLRSDFDPTLVKEKSFKSFIQRAERDRFIKVDWRDGQQDFIAELGERSLLTPTAVARPAAPGGARDIDKIARAVRKFLEEKIKAGAFPDFQRRAKVLQAAEAAYATRMQEGPFYLEEWKEITLQKLREAAVVEDQRVVFKLLLSLHYSRCLFCDTSSDRNNPLITGRRVQPADWEDYLVVNWINQVNRESTIKDADAPVYQAVFYPKVDDAPERMSRIMAMVENA
jgi:uncharacterized LabA/DUF88 family protein